MPNKSRETVVSSKNKVRKKTPENVTKEELWHKLSYIQELLLETQEQILDNKAKINNIEEAVKPKGGVQPKKKGLTIFEEKDGGRSFTDVGRDIFKQLRKEGHLTRSSLEEILVKHNMSKSKPTHLKYLQDIAGEINSYFEETEENMEANYKSGKQGGRNGGTPSRVILNEK